MSEVNGCRFCTERVIGCHATCKKYKKYRADLDESTQMKRDAKKKLYGEFCNFKREQVRKEAKKSKYKR